MTDAFRNPEALLLLLLLPALFLRHCQALRGGGAVRHSAGFAAVSRGRTWFHFLFLVKAAALVVMVVALARPQRSLSGQDTLTEGVDVMLVLDSSGSMDARDFQPDNRLEVAKRVMDDFVLGRNADRIGLVVFAARSVTRCPLTVDYDVLTRLVDTTQLGMLPDGTAIGNALATAVNRVKASKAKSRVVVLVTDGVNNTGEIDPLTAADMAQSLGVKVYCVGVGREGTAPVPALNPYTGQKELVEMEVKIDEALLREVSSRTGGKYFRAVDPDALRGIFKQIDALEKSEVKVTHWSEHTERFSPYLLAGLLLLLVWLALAETLFRRVP